jgi:GNAT superfamily N-acetyltransferase
MNASTTVYEIERLDTIDYDAMDAAFSLWYSDLEGAAVERVWIAEQGGKVVGFLTANADRMCVAIEATAEGQGIGTALVEESGVWRPEQNECPKFWARMEEKFGW